MAPPEHGARPPILRRCIERARQFFSHPERIPMLGARSQPGPPADPAPHPPRRMRSERREACSALLGAILHYCDLPTLCLSVPQPDGTLRPIRMQTLAAAAGLSLRRAERAMHDIVAAGLLKIFPRCELQADGRYVGHAALRVVPPHLFGLFGLEQRLDHDRRYLSQQRRAAAPPPNLTARARIRTAIAGLLGQTAERPAQRPVPPVAPVPVAAPALDLAPPVPGADRQQVARHYLDVMRGILAAPTAPPPLQRGRDPPPSPA